MTTQTTATAETILAAFELGFTTRKTARGDSPEAKAQRAGATQRKMTSDLARATGNWLALEVYWASSISAMVAEKAAAAKIIPC